MYLENVLAILGSAAPMKKIIHYLIQEKTGWRARFILRELFRFD